MALVTVRNVGDSPVVIDRAGRVLAVRGYEPAVDPDHAPARGLIARRAIKVIEPRDDEHVSDEARQAFEATAARNAELAEAPAPPTTDEAEASSDAPTGAETSSTSSPTRAGKRAAARRPR